MHNPGGGRIKALHPVITPPGRNPSINIRLYEQKPVTPAWLLERGVMNEEMMETLKIIVQIYILLGCISTIIIGRVVDKHREKNFIPEPGPSLKGFVVMLLGFIFWPILSFAFIKYWNK